jgi:hypothetical protein
MLDEGGIGISVEPVDNLSARLELSIAEGPEPGDALVEEGGANVFVEQNAAISLENKLLDATIEGNKVPSRSSSGTGRRMGNRKISTREGSSSYRNFVGPQRREG